MIGFEEDHINQTQILENQQPIKLKPDQQLDEKDNQSSPKTNNKQLQQKVDQAQQKQSIMQEEQKMQQSEKQQQSVQNNILEELRKINQSVIYDISVKKGRKQKFINHIHKLQNMQKHFEDQIDNFSQKIKSTIYEKFSIVYYNLARLGQNEVALETAILLLELSQSNRYLVVRWKMQLAAMKSSTSHKGAYEVAISAMNKITQIIDDLSKKLIQSKPKLASFLQLVLKVINSQRKNDFIWIHNTQNNIRCFTDHIRQLLISSQNSSQQSVISSQQRKDQLLLNSINNFKIQPFFTDYDFQIADFMSLQKLEFDYVEKYNQSADVKQIAKQIVIFASICCFTQATETYYMGNYSLKYLHFKAVQIALLAVDRNCTYVGFLLKILNDYYGTKMSQIREENSQLMETNELKRRIPKDKREINMKKLCLAE